MRYTICAFFFCSVWISNANAQQTDTTAYNFNVSEAIAYALKNQTNVLNAQIDVDKAKNTVKETIGIGLPQLTGNANFQDFIKVPTSLLPGEFFGQPGTQVPVQFGVKYNSTLGLELNQLLFDGSYIVGLQASNTFRELSGKSLKRTRIETAVSVTQAYYSVLVNAERLKLIDANLRRLTVSVNETQQLFKNGFAEKIDADRLEVLKNNLETERENVIRLLALNYNLLKFQMGMPVETQLTLKDSIESINLDKAPETTPSDTSAYQARIEYSLLQTQKRLNQLDLKRYKSQYLPTLSAFGSTSQNYQANSFTDLYQQNFPTTVIGVRLSFPIIAGGQRIYRVRNAKLEVLRAENNITNLKNTINLEISQSQTNYNNGVQSLANQQRNRELAQEVLRVSKVKYEEGVGSSIEVTTAETSLREAENNYVNALYDLLINKVNLDKALGKIDY